MRILVSLGNDVLVREAVSDETLERGVVQIATLAAEHEIVISHGDLLRLQLPALMRNAIPGRELATVSIEVVVDPEDVGSRRPVPRAITELRSIRTLLEAGVLVICTSAVTVAIDRIGELRRIDAEVDEDLVAALLARRLDADLLLMLTEVGGRPDEAKAEAARSFVAATDRRAAIGALADAVGLAGGEGGIQVQATSA
jgi:carbamate kinase